MAESVSTPAPQPAAPAHRGSAALAVLSAWLLPGLGHVYLKRRLRGVAFLVLVAASILIGDSPNTKVLVELFPDHEDFAVRLRLWSNRRPLGVAPY